MLLLCFFLIALFLLSLHASYWNFVRLNLSLNAIPRGYQGDQVQAKLKLNERSSKAKFIGQLNISEYRQKEVMTIDCHDEESISLPFKLVKRGVHPLPRITLSSGFPFGLYKCWTHLDFDRQFIVYPKPEPCELQLHSVEDQNEENEGSFKSIAGSDDFEGLKPYAVGDPINRIAWKHVAKQQQWVSKSFESQVSTTGWLKLPVLSATDIELGLSKLAYQINYCTRENIVFGLDLGTVKMEPDSGEQHRQDCLMALACYPDQNRN
jgi:uncharacterized protein (DUF58 family)